MIGQYDLFGNIEEEAIDPYEEFRKECEGYVVSMGTGFVNGKNRIKAYYEEGALTEEILKKEYGTGGNSMTYKDGSRGFHDHSPKGLEYSRYIGDMKVLFTYKEVLKLITEAIENGRY